LRTHPDRLIQPALLIGGHTLKVSQIGQARKLWRSADLMPRNLNRRVEVVFPVKDPRLVSRLRDEILEVYLADTVNAHEMQTGGSYRRPWRSETVGGTDSHQRCMSVRPGADSEGR
jgi:polyphosphate kinase